MITKQEMIELTYKNKITNTKGFSDVLSSVEAQMIIEAKKGNESVDINVNTLVQQFMPSATLFADVSTEIQNTLTDNLYSVHGYTSYQSEHITIAWK